MQKEFSMILIHFISHFRYFQIFLLKNAMRYLENAIYKLINMLGVFLLLQAIMWAFIFFPFKCPYCIMFFLEDILY